MDNFTGPHRGIKPIPQYFQGIYEYKNSISDSTSKSNVIIISTTSTVTSLATILNIVNHYVSKVCNNFPVLWKVVNSWISSNQLRNSVVPYHKI